MARRRGTRGVPSRAVPDPSPADPSSAAAAPPVEPGRGGAGAGPALGVLASGTGTILQAVLDAGLDVAAVVVDRPCRATEVAAGAGVPVEVVARGDFGPGFDRPGYTTAVVAALERHRIEVVAMAGFGTVLSAEIFARYPGRVLNTHPALLPAFRGWHAVREALAAGVAETGCTVHLATEAVDDGPILATEAVPVLAGDTEELLHERIKAVERRLYPATIATFLASCTDPTADRKPTTITEQMETSRQMTVTEQMGARR